MSSTTYKATVHNGQIKLPETVHLPEDTRVFVVVPETSETQRFTVMTGEDGLPLIRTSSGIIASQLVKFLS